VEPSPKPIIIQRVRKYLNIKSNNKL